ncbi:MAG: EutP/PduV family microcompartment system protein [Betaproteobacteria bacterium]
MLLGDIGAGKTTLINALCGKNETARKTQAVEFEGNGLDTPGEYLSHPRFYSALLCTAQEADTLVYVHSADRDSCRLPPGFMEVYNGKDIVGVITKTDLPDASPEAAHELLRANGIRGPIFRVSSTDPASLLPLKALLMGTSKYAKEHFE